MSIASSLVNWRVAPGHEGNQKMLTDGSAIVSRHLLSHHTSSGAGSVVSRNACRKERKIGTEEKIRNEYLDSRDEDLEEGEERKEERIRNGYLNRKDTMLRKGRGRNWCVKAWDERQGFT